MSSGIFHMRKLVARMILASAGLVVFSVIAAVLSGCGSGNDRSAAQPEMDTGGRLQIAETGFDFGSVPVNQQVEHEFVVRNVGTGVLNLDQPLVKRLEGC